MYARKKSKDKKPPTVAQVPAQARPEPAALQKMPAYAQRRVQTKVTVGPAGDSFEREADSVAQRVSKGEKVAPETISPLGAAPRRAPAPEKKPEPKPETTKPVQRREAAGAPGTASQQSALTSHAMDTAADQAIGQKGPGRPLNAAVQQTLAERMGTDFSHVRVHDGPEAQEATRALHARAFTHGSDIWLGTGESDSDLPLIAHELTHVVQQTEGAHRKAIQRKPGEAASTKPTATKKEITIDTPVATSINAADMAAVKGLMPEGKFRRTRGYNRAKTNDPKQAALWDKTVKQEAIENKLKSKFQMQEGGLYLIRATGQGAGYDRLGSPALIASSLKRPFWDKAGNFVAHQVDHKVELVFTGWPTIGVGNQITNMELLDAKSNQAAGNQHLKAIDQALNAYLKGPKASELPKEDQNLKSLRASYDIIFENLTPVAKDEFGSVYTQSDIETDAKHIDYLASAKSKGRIKVHDLQNPNPPETSPFSPLAEKTIETLVGSKDKFALYTKPGRGGKIGIDLPVKGKGKSAFIPGYKITNLTLNPETPGDAIGSLEGEPFPNLNRFFQIEGGSPWPIRRFSSDPAFKYAGYLVTPTVKALDLKGASPVRIDSISVEEAGLTLVGQVLPTVPLIKDLGIDLVIQGDDVRLERIFQAGEFQLPGPIKATGGSITFGLGLKSGLSLDGRVDLEVERVGKGFLAASASTGQGFALSGQFDFDSKLFDRASVSASYKKSASGNYDLMIQGEVAIEKEGKVKGVKSASATALYEKGKLAASGTAVLSIPGVKQADLQVNYDEKEGLLINGGITLADNIPGIQSGSGKVIVKKKEGDEYHLAASGTVVPKIPGVATALSFSVEDDLFTAEASVGYEKGRLKGAILVGVTNRPVDSDGKAGTGPSGKSLKDVKVYGGGSLTLQLTSWLQGTAGIKFKPDGSIEVMGEIALPATLKIFDEKSLEKNLFKINLDIPLVGVSAMGQNVGIFASIGGGLDLSAGVGPGELQDAKIGVTYDPNDESKTHVTGGAKFHIPAHAGLRLFVRGSVGVGIPLVDARAGLEVGGELGLAGALDASVMVDWTPQRGMVLDAKGSIFVEPKFKFDISAFVLVELDLLLDTITLYEGKWQLAAYEWGSGLRLGVELPIHYEEGKPFNPSMDDLKFTLPKIEPGAVLNDLVHKVID